VTFRFTPAAEADRADIVDYIATEASPDRAVAVLREILQAAERIAEMPRMGHARRDLTEEPVLFWSVYS
jgi:plasmid stabilization system protein ParE